MCRGQTQWKPHGAYALSAASDDSSGDEKKLYTLVAHKTTDGRMVKPIFKKITWDGVPVTMLIDTGSPVSVISMSLFKQNQSRWPPPSSTTLRLSCFLGELPVVGELHMKATCEGHDIQGTLVIVDTPGPALCGRDTIKAFNNCGVAMMIPNFVATLNTRKEDGTSQQLQTLLKEFEDVFSPGLGLYKGPPVKLILKENATPRFCKARTVPYALTTKVSDALDRLVADGVISPVMAAEWATPVVPVVKTDGSIRLCGDFRLTVNVATVTEQYPLPRVDDIFARLNGGEVFSTLDLTQAYNQLPLDNEAKKLTVINTHKGLFCFNRLPFGISSAPAIFQRHMDSLFKDLPGVQAYLDDIIVAEKRNDTSLLKQVLQRLRDYGLRLNIKKCKFRQEEVTFLGHRVDANGLKPKDDNIEAVLQAPVPKSVSELKSFLGLINYYAKFLPNLSTVLAPLYNLLTKGATWKWQQVHEEAVRKVKQAIQASKFLTHFDPNKPLKLECDASPVGVGAVLSHRINGTDYPIGFRSRTLSKAERNYSQLEKEALALVFGVTRFKDYLYGNHFVLVTDHKPLTGLFNPGKAIPPMAAARIQRWALLLDNYHYTLQYRRGIENSNADALSRLPLPNKLHDTSTEDPPEYVLYSECWEKKAISVRDVAHFTETDPLLQQVKFWIKKGWPKFLSEEQIRFRPYFSKKAELTYYQDLVYWGHRIVLPTALNRRILDLLHETHPGMATMKNIARSLFWFPGLDGEIERLVRECPACVQAAAMPPAQTPVPWPTTGEKWSRLHADYAGPIEGHMILVVVDSETKWIEAVPTKSATAEVTVEALRAMFARFGLPRTLVTDNGPQFTGFHFRNFLAQNQVKHLTTAPYHPQSNGLAERAVRTLKEGLKKNYEIPLQTRISRLLFRYRRTPVKEGKSPAELLLGYQIRTKLDCIMPTTEAVKAKPCNEREQRWQAGQRVWTRTFQPRKKWIPGIVRDQQGKRMVTVDTTQGTERRHFDQVRRRDVSVDESCDTDTLSPRQELSGESASDSLTPATQPLRRSTRQRRPPDRLNF